MLFGLAAVNRFRLTEPAERGDRAATRRLRRSILIETMLVVAILGVAAASRFTPPPRALAEASAAPAMVHIHTNKAMVDLTITPGRAGPVTASMLLMSGDFGPLDAKEVTLKFTNPNAGIEQIERTAPSDGTWRVGDLTVPLAGRWSVRIKRKLVGAKPPLRPSHVWSIRTKLQIEGKKRDLALINLAIDSKLRGCDVVAVRVDDVAPSGYATYRATIRQKKTGRPVRFAGRGNSDRGLTTRQYARLVQEWVVSIGLDPAKFGTHLLRRTKAVLI